jgi:exodeoxyribonuclease-5
MSDPPSTTQSVVWSPQQAAALDDVGSWLRSGREQIFRLFGYAGTGKTELAKHLARMQSGMTLFAAFTGKAAYVMSQRGCMGATTIHRLIYVPREKSRERLRTLQGELTDLLLVEPDSIKVREIRGKIAEETKLLKRPSFSLNSESVVRDASLVIIDECSMVDERIGQDLLSFGTKILVIGDPAQLPPVMGTGFFTNGKPDAMLTEIHRQARGNPIIQLATAVREGQKLEEGTYGSSRVIDWADVEPEDALAVDQILVGTNKLRRGTNQRMRELLGFKTHLPEANDRLVCLRNNHQEGLMNGAIWKVLAAGSADQDQIPLTIESEDGAHLDVMAHLAPFMGQEVEHWTRRDAQEFDFGYALTVHKSQGSQWPKVLVFDESKKFSQAARAWLYTAVTRASESLTIVR